MKLHYVFQVATSQPLCLLEVDPHRHRADVGSRLIDAVHRGIRIAGDGSRLEQKSLVRHINSQGLPAEKACL